MLRYLQSQRKYLKSAQNGGHRGFTTAVAVLSYIDKEQVLTVRCYCNLHGLWLAK
ncbi:MAG: desulfoferrodoxin family protein [Bacillota bacterium]